MNQVLNRCPVCGSELIVTRLRCRACSTALEGQFALGVFSTLTSDQLDFIETFVRCEGKFTRMEGELGLSYPTIRNRLHDIIRAMGYEPGAEEPAAPSDEERRAVLTKLEAGDITAEDAIGLLKGES